METIYTHQDFISAISVAKEVSKEQLNDFQYNVIRQTGIFQIDKKSNKDWYVVPWTEFETNEKLHFETFEAAVKFCVQTKAYWKNEAFYSKFGLGTLRQLGSIAERFECHQITRIINRTIPKKESGVPGCFKRRH